MSAPLEFLRTFAGHLRASGIPFAITSGMACVHFGLQQSTKDSDWIIPSHALVRLRELLIGLEGSLPRWRVSYRQIFGAPLEEEFMSHGWTSHLSIWDGPDSVEHRVDLFSKPPRVRAEELAVDDEGWATRHVVAQMKRTDRDKDWPMVQGLGRQLWERNSWLALLHLTSAEALLAAWHAAPAEARASMAVRRPLLRALDGDPAPTGLEIERLLAVERLIWQKVNAHRYQLYTRAWKDFFRRWRQDEDWEWPTHEEFEAQHRRLLEAAHRHELPADPMAARPAHQLVKRALAEVSVLARASETEIAVVLPPIEELLP